MCEPDLIPTEMLKNDRAVHTRCPENMSEQRQVTSGLIHSYRKHLLDTYVVSIMSMMQFFVSHDDFPVLFQVFVVSVRSEIINDQLVHTYYKCIYSNSSIQ